MKVCASVFLQVLTYRMTLFEQVFKIRASAWNLPGFFEGFCATSKAINGLLAACVQSECRF